MIKLTVERNDRDTRKESWKIVGSKGEGESLADKIEVVRQVESRDERRNIIGNLTDTCVNVINEAKRSLGIIKPAEIRRTYFKENSKYGQLMQMGLPGMTELGSVKVKSDFPDEPRITYRCPDCLAVAQKHDQQVLEWGFYEWFRKNPGNEAQVWENAGFGKPNTDIYLLVGNQMAHRTSFMVISVLRVPSGAVNAPLFPYVKVTDE